MSYCKSLPWNIALSQVIGEVVMVHVLLWGASFAAGAHGPH